MITNEFSGSDDGGSSSNDDDDSDSFEIFHEVRDAAEFTEYEVDSDADREEIKQREGDRDSSKESDEDSIIADVFHIDIVMEDGGGDSSFWADSESDFELSNFDPEIGPGGTESWNCVACKTPNEMRMRYCHKCWEVSF